MTEWISGFLLPPGLPVFLVLCGLLCLWWRPWLAHTLFIVSIFLGFFLSTHAAAQRISRLTIAPIPEMTEWLPNGKETIWIVAGAGDIRPEPVMNAEWVLGPQTLNLLQIVARNYQQNGIEIAVIGRSRPNQPVQESALMNQTLIEQFKLPVHYLLDDAESLTTLAKKLQVFAQAQSPKRLVIFCPALKSRRLVAFLNKEKINWTVVPIMDSSLNVEDWRRYVPTGEGLRLSRKALAELWKYWLL